MNKLQNITQKTYDTISSDWDTKREYVWKPVKQFLENQDNKQKLKLLDLGCGTGRHLELAQKIGYENLNLTGADYSIGQLNIVKQKGFQIKKTDLEKLEFNNEEFDLIICIAAHHHLLEPNKQLSSLEEMRRILKNDGKILLSNWFPSKDFIEQQLKKKKFEFIDKQKVKVTYTFNKQKLDRYYYLFEEQELQQLCNKAKLKIIKKEFDNGNIYLTLTK